MSNMPWVQFYPSDWLAGTRGMTAAETGIYITLIALMYERREPLPSDTERLARMCGASKREFSAALKGLIDDGKIMIVDGALWNERVGKEQEKRENFSKKQRAAVSKRWEKTEQKQCEADTTVIPATRVTTTTTIIEKKEREETRANALAPSFEAFWTIFPNKVGKRDAEKAFAKAIKRAAVETIMAGLRGYVGKTDDRPWCNPSTFLNQDRWNDAPAIVAPRQSRPPPRVDGFAQAICEDLKRAQRE